MGIDRWQDPLRFSSFKQKDKQMKRGFCRSRRRGRVNTQWDDDGDKIRLRLDLINFVLWSGWAGERLVSEVIPLVAEATKEAQRFDFAG